MKPNIIYILCDDLGYGDMRGNDPACKIPTPNLDALAARGMRFTNAHAGSSLCTPSRYNILTGRYAWRSRLKRGIVWEWDGALIEPGRLTVAGLLREQGYHTACIGKWHLGWDWQTTDGRHPNETLPFGDAVRDQRAAFAEDRIDLAGRIGGGPVDRGFDSYFGVDVPNFPPYTWFENDRLAEIPTVDKPDSMYGHAGLMLPDWSLEAMIPEFARRATALIEERAARTDGQPFFLYFPLTSPHSPVVPNKAFRGTSGIGNYGDFVCEIDDLVGQVMAALDRGGIADNTLVIFTSDNGPEKRTPDDEGVFERAERTGHYSMGSWRGMKRDVWEGGHREPFIASWPAVIPAGTVCDQLVGLGDFMATCAEITGAERPEGAGEDSVSMLPLLKGRTDRPTREALVHHSCSGAFALRADDWVLIDAPSGGENEEPDWFARERGYAPHDQPGELFDLREDPQERRNLYADRPGVVAELKARLEAIKKA
ncbi:MAG: arylsulfatase [Lentisphaerae bacterium]|nr:arylsulfatase [Lentisphaerota bacterium]